MNWFELYRDIFYQEKMVKCQQNTFSDVEMIMELKSKGKDESILRSNVEQRIMMQEMKEDKERTRLHRVMK